MKRIFYLLLGIVIIACACQTEPDENSIAVLPFRNDSSDESNTYFFNGMRSGIINELANKENFKVIGSKSSGAFMNTNMTISEIAKELNVRYVVEVNTQRNVDSMTVKVYSIGPFPFDSNLALEKKYYYTIEETNDLVSLYSQITQDISAEIKKTPN